MNYTVNDFTFMSEGNLAKIKGKTYIPNTKNIKGIVQIIHGMCECIDRYTPFIEYLLKHNFMVVGHDQLGHGNSVNTDKDRGYFGEKAGDKTLVADAYYITKQAKSLYPDLPYFIFGHSMGSFVTRLIAAKYGEDIDGIILCGTGGPNPLYKTGVDIANKLIAKKGPEYRSEFLTDLACNFFNATIPNTNNLYDWISRDKDVINARPTDEFSNFVFTVSAYRDVFMLVKKANEMSKINSIPKDMHVFLISGSKDPVGTNTLGVSKYSNQLLAAGVKDTTLTIYKDARHELLNELNKKQVYKDILRWLNETLEVMEFNQKQAFELEDKVIENIMGQVSNYAIEGVKENVGGPFGAAILQITSKEEKEIYGLSDVKLISLARNSVISSNDPTAHAEVNAIREATRRLGRFDISDCILLTSGKSCPMCIAAAYWAKIPLVYYACDYKDAEEAGFDDREIADYISHVKGTYSLKEVKTHEALGKKVFKVWNDKKEKTQY
ncbi:MAG: alpha/beta fold hydrolase [Clostridia bacterium]